MGPMRAMMPQNDINKQTCQACNSFRFGFIISTLKIKFIFTSCKLKPSRWFLDLFNSSYRHSYALLRNYQNGFNIPVGKYINFLTIFT